MTLRWFLSSTVRQATDMRKHVLKLLNSQRDILSAQAVSALEAALMEIKKALDENADVPALRKQMEALEKVATKWIKPYPYADWRDNVEVFLVAIVVAMGIRTFFLQPFKIPTGSMQPTLFGVQTVDLRSDPNFHMPGFLTRAYELVVHGTFYHQFIAPQDGEFMQAGRVDHSLHVLNRQTLWVRYNGSSGEVPLTLWCGPEDDRNQLEAGLTRPFSFHKGEPIICFKETTGDHLFVDRFTYNFRQPHRGEIVVFLTKGIAGIRDQDQFYIKRLIGLGDEKVSIGEDRHVRIDGRRLDASTPHFENVYGFDPRSVPQDSHYSGHTLDGRSSLSSPDR
ncbi:MAG TPA: S26 family signal peptidase, partial [Candidatus Cybelea sp.]|nr:S26 family signal peptidase [Candidatus Cybelea sp.]